MLTRLITLVVFLFFVGCAHVPRKAVRSAHQDKITLTLTSKLGEGIAKSERNAPPVSDSTTTISSLPVTEDRDTYRADEGAIYALVTFQMMKDRHTIRWRWIDPSGRVYIDTSPMDVGTTGALYREVNAHHKINLKGEAAQNPGEWRIEAVIEEVDNDGPATRIARAFRIDPSHAALPPQADVASSLAVEPLAEGPSPLVPEPALNVVRQPTEIGPYIGVASPLAALPGPISLLFKFGKAMLTLETKQALTQQVEGFKKAKTIFIRGYHDATGLSSFNRILARQRAEAVASFLMAQGISEETMRIKGMTDFYFAPNDTRKNRGQNRRVTVEASNE